VNIDNREDISDDIIEADAWTRSRSPHGRASTRNSSGISTVSAVSTTSKTRMKTVSSKSSTIIPPVAGTIRSMMNSAITII